MGNFVAHLSLENSSFLVKSKKHVVSGLHPEFLHQICFNSVNFEY